MRVVAIVQARMGSSRLPGKVLMDIGGASTLSRVIARMSRSQRIDQIVVATTSSPADDAIVAESEQMGIKVFRGSEQDVLSRYFQAAALFNADIVARITSDCPLVDPGIVDEVVKVCVINKGDLACNDLPPTFPRGLDVEAFTATALARMQQIAVQPYQREHVTPLLYEREDLFRIFSIYAERDYSRHRWTLDTFEDLSLIRAIYSHFDGRDDFTWREVLTLVEKLPHLQAINAHIVQKRVQDGAMAH